MTPRILIIDDAKTDRLLITTTLRDRFGDTIEILETESVESSVKQLISGRCDVIILDMNLTGVSGTDAVHEVRKFDSLASIIVVTGSPSSVLEMGTIARGAVAFCGKDQMIEKLPNLVLDAWQRRLRLTERDNRIDQRIDSIVGVLERSSGRLNQLEHLAEKLTLSVFGPGDEPGLLHAVDKNTERCNEYEKLKHKAMLGAIGIIVTSVLAVLVTLLTK